MNSIFLRAKHWQLFIPLLVIPFVIMILFGMIVAFTVINQNPKGPEDIIWIFYFFPIVFAVSSFVQFGWLWTVITKLSALVPKNQVKFPIGRIKFFFIIPIIYFCLIPFYIVFVIQSFSHQRIDDLIEIAILGIFVFIFHFFSIFCILHTFFFVAKTIRSAELQRNTTFSDFAGYFFLTWFFPVGVWFLQPKINALINQENDFVVSTNEELLD